LHFVMAILKNFLCSAEIIMTWRLSRKGTST